MNYDVFNMELLQTYLICLTPMKLKRLKLFIFKIFPSAVSTQAHWLWYYKIKLKVELGPTFY